MANSPELLIVAPSDKCWQDLVASTPQANIFHHPSWSRLLAECYGFKPKVLVIPSTDSGCTAGCPVMEVNRTLSGKRWVALPFSDHCAPLYGDALQLESLMKWFSQLYWGGGLSEIEIRWMHPSITSFQVATHNVLSQIRLDSDSTIVAGKFHRKHIHELTKAQQNNRIHVERGTNAQDLNEFYRLHLQTRKRFGLPVQPKRFFRLLRDFVLEPGLGYIATAYCDNECVAADIFLHWQRTLTYKYSAGSDAARDSRANYLLLWDAIQWGCDNGYSWLDLGRSSLSNAGLRKFKARWGAIETPLSYMSLPNKPVDQSQGRLMLLVHAFIRHSPSWVCRMAGELLYKYNA